MQAQRDPNHVPVALAFDYNEGVTSEFEVDPITGYLLVEFQPWPLLSYIPPRGNAERDANHVHAGLIVNESSRNQLQNLPANHATGLLDIEYTLI